MKNWQKIKQNPELKKKFLIREKVIDGIREFFKGQGFNEVETPQMVRYPGTEPFLEIFETKLRRVGEVQKRAFMSTSPELAMKKLLVAGLTKIFQVCKSFRNGEGLSPKHSSEFTILEWYRAEANYEDIMQDCEELLWFLLQKINTNNFSILQSTDHHPPSSDHQPTKLNNNDLSKNQKSDFNISRSQSSSLLIYQGKKYDLTIPWPRLSVAQAFGRWVKIDEDSLLNRDLLVQRAKKEGYSVDENTTWEEAYSQLFLNLIEPEIARFKTPLILYDYPASQAAYSKKKKGDPRFAQRFEFYLAGLELGNAFSEENDPKIQKKKFAEDLALRKKLGKISYKMDLDYIKALEVGLPSCGGIAVGVDRLVMLLSNSRSIQETIFFPAEETF